MRLNGKEGTHQRNHRIKRRIKRTKSRFKGQKLCITYPCLHGFSAIAITDRALHAIDYDVIQQHGQDKGLRRSDNSIVVSLPTQCQIPLPGLAKDLAPKVISLFFSPMHPELGKAGKNLLHQSGFLVIGGDKPALEPQHAPINEGRNQTPDEPDCHSCRRKFQTVPTHEEKAPERKHRIEDRRHKIAADDLFYRFNAPHTAG